MPMGNGTGPMGMGPQIGRGMGPCGGGFGWGRGHGRGYGRVMGGWLWKKYQKLSKDDRRQILQEEVEDLKAELQQAEQAIVELDKEA